MEAGSGTLKSLSSSRSRALAVPSAVIFLNSCTFSVSLMLLGLVPLGSDVEMKNSPLTCLCVLLLLECLPLFQTPKTLGCSFDMEF